MNTNTMPYDNIFDFSKYKKSRMRVRTITYDLCNPDCKYFRQKQIDKLLSTIED